MTWRVHIDRLVLTDLSLDPAGAERLRWQLEVELQNLLADRPAPAGPLPVAIEQIATQPVSLGALREDGLTTTLARRIADALPGPAGHGTELRKNDV